MELNLKILRETFYVSLLILQKTIPDLNGKSMSNVNSHRKIQLLVIYIFFDCHKKYSLKTKDCKLLRDFNTSAKGLDLREHYMRNWIVSKGHFTSCNSAVI